jgi:hypothetical protein
VRIHSGMNSMMQDYRKEKTQLAQNKLFFLILNVVFT